MTINLISKVAKKFMLKLKYVIPFLLLSNTGFNSEEVSHEQLSFSIIKSGSTIGFIQIEKETKGELVTYKVNSEVNAKILLNFKAIGVEKSVYDKNVLIYSSIYRKINNRVKIDQTLSLASGRYELLEDQKKEVLNINAIHHNMITLFFSEPVNIDHVFSEKFKMMLKIESLGKGSYKVEFPNRSTSIFHYKNGQCEWLESEGTFYKVKLIKSNK